MSEKAQGRPAVVFGHHPLRWVTTDYMTEPIFNELKPSVRRFDSFFFVPTSVLQVKEWDDVLHWRPYALPAVPQTQRRPDGDDLHSA